MAGPDAGLILVYGGEGGTAGLAWPALQELGATLRPGDRLILWDVDDPAAATLPFVLPAWAALRLGQYVGPAEGLRAEALSSQPSAGAGEPAGAAHRPVAVLFTSGRAREALAFLQDPAAEARLVPAGLDLRREAVLHDLGRLYDLTDRLRRECPWDRKQTQEDIVAYTLEETYELIDAVRTPGERRDDLIAGELGDLLFQVYFLARVAEGEGWYDLGEVADGIRRKLVRRHPHIFGEAVAETPDDVRRTWDQIKRTTEGREGIFHEVPVAFPSVLFAQKLQQRAATVGFDWERAEDVLGKIREEADELGEEMAGADPMRVAEETGDLLFAMVNLARKLKVDPELALRAAAHRFQERVERAEGLAEAEGNDFEGLSLEGKERYFQRAKAEIRDQVQGGTDQGGQQG